MSLPFHFEIPVSFFEKADAEPEKTRRIGGIISTESPDRQGEVILQRGLDFDDFVKHGWFNDNHSKATTGILGYPEFVKPFRKGDTLPDGKIAKSNGTWAEGYMLDTDDARKIWDLGKALQKTARRLGFSVEGKIESRTGPNDRIIAKAKIRNVAITNCPVNTDSRLEVLAKSLMAVEQCEPMDLQKTLGMGTATPGVSVATQGPQTGMGAGRVIAGQSLEQDEFDLTGPKKKKKVQKSLSYAEAVAWVQQRLPAASCGSSPQAHRNNDDPQAGRQIVNPQQRSAQMAKKEDELEKSKKLKPLTAQQMQKGMDGDEDAGGDDSEDNGDDGDDDSEDGDNKMKKGGIPPQFLKNKGKGDAEPDADDEGDGKDMKKSEVTGADLDKSIAKLNEFTQSNDPASRKESLLSKALKEDLSKSEQDELFKLVGGAKEETKKSLGGTVTKGLSENSTLQKALDVSDFLDEQHKELCKSLDALGEYVEKSSARQSTFNVILAKAVSDVAKVVKSLAEGQAVTDAQPVRQPKSQLTKSQALQKGFGGAAPSDEENQLSKSQILDGLDLVMEKSGGTLESGEDVLKAISKYEQTNQISKSMLGEAVKALKTGKSATAH